MRMLVTKLALSFGIYFSKNILYDCIKIHKLNRQYHQQQGLAVADKATRRAASQ